MRVELRFTAGTGIHHDLSAVRQDGHCLWVAGDESAAVERLTWRDGAYQDHQSFRLSEFVELPAGPDDEADIEGLGRADGWLWVVGSHSLKRRRVKPGQTGEKARKRLASVLREENRFILVRLPLVERDGLPFPVRQDGRRTAAILSGPGRNLADMLDDDPHLRPFLHLPGKDNGFDIEGIAVIGSRVLVGLRGPVLRGWAVVLEIRPETNPHDPHRLRLDGGYQTHFVDLDGLGIRDLCPIGDDLLILAGPTMTLDGAFRVLRWRPNGDFANPPTLVTELPMVPGADRPEGIALLPDGRLLIVYDTPAPERLTLDGVYADIVQV
ncbi:DUF3616 domain-containing protein [Acrocarpospora pleiomorpha]|uniref:DUF3616 domain-containing protein n=1 Tax=Acrocarpospora pleiomorpha TaxID=90975 RepID=UPI0012D36C33|nr:DUF3616 domain-containing protein [Acrocarpospora pleiomorpha]